MLPTKPQTRLNLSSPLIKNVASHSFHYPFQWKNFFSTLIEPYVGYVTPPLSPLYEVGCCFGLCEDGGCEIYLKRYMDTEDKLSIKLGNITGPGF